MDTDVLSLVTGLYDVSLGELRWPELVGQLPERFLADGAVVFCASRAKLFWLHSHGFDRGLVLPHQEFVAAFDRDIADRGPFTGTGYCRDCTSRGGHSRFLGAAISIDESRLLGVSVHRSSSRGDFVRADRERLDSLMPHVARAGRLGAVAEDRDWRSKALALAFNQLSFGIILLAEDRHIVEMNELGAKLLQGSPAVSIRRRRLKASFNDEGRALHGAIAESMAMSAAGSSGGPVFTTITSRSSIIRVAVAPFSRGVPAQAPAEYPACLLALSDGRLHLPARADFIASAYGLTGRESQVISMLVEGFGINEIARRLERSEETIRSHVKGLMRKLNVKRQSDLIRVALSAPLRPWVDGCCVGSDHGAV